MLHRTKFFAMKQKTTCCLGTYFLLEVCEEINGRNSHFFIIIILNLFADFFKIDQMLSFQLEFQKIQGKAC